MIESSPKNNNFVLNSALMAAMAFIALFAHTLLRTQADVIVVSSLGAEMIPYLKFSTLAPELCLLLFFIGFYKKDRMELFFTISGVFFTFSLALLAILYLLFPDHIKTIKELTYFSYITLKMWPVVIYSALFWILANQIFTTKQAAIAYPIILALINVSMVFSGYLISTVSSLENITTPVFLAISALATVGILVLSKILFKNQKAYEVQEEKDIKVNLGEKFLYLFFLALIFIAGSFVTHGFETTVRLLAREAFPDLMEYTNFMIQSLYYTGRIILAIMLLSVWWAAVFGWRISSLLIPFITILFMIMFWHAQISNEPYANFMNTLLGVNMTPAQGVVAYISLMMVIFKGLASLFMVTKQMAFIPLPASTKARANAFIGGIIGGNILIPGLSSLLIVSNDTIPDKHALMGYPIVIALIIIALIIWIVAVLVVGYMYKSFENRKKIANPEI